MAKLYYSNLPPEVQETIKKLTGYTDDQLENMENGKPPSPKKGRGKAERKPKASLKQTLIILAWIVGISLALTFAGYFAATL